MIRRVFRDWSWHDLRGEGGAIFSDCESYRYVLWRDWRDPLFVTPLNHLVAICLNPSTATERASDPTCTTLLKLAVREGRNGLVVLNAFALRSTDPKALYSAADPIGPDNDAHIAEWIRGAKVLLVAWGNHGALRGRGDELAITLRAYGYQPKCFGVTGKGQPKHPLYQPDDAALVAFVQEVAS